jgi:uncharacterized protein YpuA (DUF1002 family)
MPTLDITAYTFQILSERNRVFERLAIVKIGLDTAQRHLIDRLAETRAQCDKTHTEFTVALRGMDVEKMTRTLAEYRKAQAEFKEIHDLEREIEEKLEASAKELEAYKKETDDIILGLRFIVADEDSDQWTAVSLRTQYNEGTLHA